MPLPILHFQEGNTKLSFEIHQGLIAHIHGRFQATLLVFRQGLPQAVFDLVQNLLAFRHEHAMQRFAAPCLR
ncbi:MAG: hypothetical protein C4293_14365 [Nitrospiraceae bacterium]